MSGPARTVVYLVRHASTEWNEEGRWQCQDDRPLSGRGRIQAAAAARWLSGVHARSPFDAIYASPLQRAMRTAEAISSAVGLGFKVEPLLREFDCGNLSGLTFEDARRLNGDFFARLEGNWLDERYPGGESVRDYWEEAVIPGLCGIHGRHPGRQVIAVTHAGFIRSAAMQVMGCPLERPIKGLAIDNGACFVLEVEGTGSDHLLTGRAVQLNITSYLRCDPALSGQEVL